MKTRIKTKIQLHCTVIWGWGDRGLIVNNIQLNIISLALMEFLFVFEALMFKIDIHFMISVYHYFIIITFMTSCLVVI